MLVTPITDTLACTLPVLKREAEPLLQVTDDVAYILSDAYCQYYIREVSPLPFIGELVHS